MTFCLDKRLSAEADARQEYITSIFKVNLVKWSENESFIIYKSFPLNTVDIMYIVGHNKSVGFFLQNNLIEENTIVVIACDLGYLKQYKVPNKKVYLSYRDACGFTRCRYGENYGFGFDPVDSELDLYNCTNKDIFERIDSSFERLV